MNEGEAEATPPPGGLSGCLRESDGSDLKILVNSPDEVVEASFQSKR